MACPPPAHHQGLDPRRTADGKTFTAILLGALADQDVAAAEAEARGRAGAEAAARKAARIELAQLQRASAAEIARLQRELAEADRAAEHQLQAVAADAYHPGRLEPDPELAREPRWWWQAAPALFKWRAQVDELADQVLDYLGEHERDFLARDQHRRYVEAVREYRGAIDRCLELALEPLRAIWASAAPGPGLPSGCTGSARLPTSDQR